VLASAAIIRRFKPSEDYSLSPRGEGPDEGGLFVAEVRGSDLEVHRKTRKIKKADRFPDPLLRFNFLTSQRPHQRQ
jgi:hypothetical protein